MTSGVDGPEVWAKAGSPENLSLEGRSELRRRQGWGDLLGPPHRALMGSGAASDQLQSPRY